MIFLYKKEMKKNIVCKECFFFIHGWISTLFNGLDSNLNLVFVVETLNPSKNLRCEEVVTFIFVQRDQFWTFFPLQILGQFSPLQGQNLHKESFLMVFFW